jgi:PAS domain S-box-containing protein
MPKSILKFWQSLELDDPLAPLFGTAPVMMHSIDITGTLIRVSGFWAHKLGYTVEEMVGCKAVDFLSEESRRHAIEIAQPKVLETGKVYNVEYDFVCKDGKLLPVLLSAISEYDDDGNHVRSLAVIFDNTEAKRVAAELRQKQRMEAIGALVGGVAHDFNNLLAIVLGNLEFLKDDPDDEDRLEFIDDAMTATLRGRELVQQLLSYGRDANFVPRLIDLNEVVMGVDRLIRRLLPLNIELSTITGPDLWKSKIDTAQLETAMLNIVNNARDALADGGRITVETCNVRIGSEYTDLENDEIDPGSYVMLKISDTGMGMDHGTITRIFEPFFTTKPVGKGSGLGLAMVCGFMRQSNGVSRVVSKEGSGTSVKLYFPAQRSDDEEPRAGRQACKEGSKVEHTICAEDGD